jgi:hypothetical protein
MAKDTITYSWNCRTVDCYPTKDDNTDVIYNVHWTYTATSSKKDSEDNPYSAGIIGTQVIATDDITDFVPFADLDNEKVTEWVTTVMGEDTVTSYQDSLASQIADKITPKSITLTVAE